MEKIKAAWKKTAEFIRKPPLIPVIVFWALALVFFIFFFSFVLDMRADTSAICVYCFFPVILFVVIYSVLVTSKRILAIVLKFLSRYKYGKRLAKEYVFRVNFFSSISTVISVFYVIYNLIIACVMKSAWYGSLTVAYFLLVLMRLYCLDRHRVQLKTHEVDFYYAYRAFSRIGAFLLMYAAVFSLAIYQMFSVGNVTVYPRFILYVVIGYTIYKSILCVYSYTRARRYRNPIWRAIRHIAVADTIVSVVSLLYSMLYDMIARDYIHVFNVLAGILGIVGAVCIAWIAIYTIWNGVQGAKATKYLGRERVVHMDDLLGISHLAEEEVDLGYDEEPRYAERGAEELVADLESGFSSGDEDYGDQ